MLDEDVELVVRRDGDERVVDDRVSDLGLRRHELEAAGVLRVLAGQIADLAVERRREEHGLA